VAQLPQVRLCAEAAAVAGRADIIAGVVAAAASRLAS